MNCQLIQVNKDITQIKQGNIKSLKFSFYFSSIFIILSNGKLFISKGQATISSDPSGFTLNQLSKPGGFPGGFFDK